MPRTWSASEAPGRGAIIHRMSALDGLIGGRRERRRFDRLTVGLAGLAAATAGTVVAGEVARLARRRVKADEGADGVLETAEHAIVVAGQATQDTVAVVREGYEAASGKERVLFNMLSGFLGGFALMRLSTWGIRGGWWPFGEVSLGGRHIHHFVPGILIAFGSGATALITDDARLERGLALPFGAGIGLTFDEAALLLDLRDVYWTREGLLSVQVSFGVMALMGATILALRILRRGEERVEARGLIPPDPGEEPLAWSATASVPEPA
jgi:hypothetical protein